jgi:hypothetical protein
MTTHPAFDAVVVGGGILGSATAYHLVGARTLHPASGRRRLPGPRGLARILLAMSHGTPFRTIALVLVTVLLVVTATPAKAEALEPLVIVALASLALAGLVIIGYLIIANVEGRRLADEGELIWVAHVPQS